MKFQWNTLWMSWLFIVYIILNVEIQAKSQWNMGLIVLMIIEAMAVGMYEELVFRGLILTYLLKELENHKKGVFYSAIVGSIIFFSGCQSTFLLSIGALLLPTAAIPFRAFLDASWP